MELDGVVLDLPELEGVVVLNIKSWGAGVEVWGDGNSLGPCKSVVLICKHLSTTSMSCVCVGLMMVCWKCLVSIPLCT